MGITLDGLKIESSVCPLNSIDIKKLKQNKPDLVLLSFATFPLIELTQEIIGSSNKIEEIALLSNELNCIVMCGIVSKILQKEFLNIVIANKGKIIDVTDKKFNFNGENISEDKNLKAYKVGKSTFGIIIDNDLFYPDIWNNYHKNCDAVIVISRGLFKDYENAVIEAYSTLTSLKSYYLCN